MSGVEIGGGWKSNNAFSHSLSYIPSSILSKATATAIRLVCRRRLTDSFASSIHARRFRISRQICSLPQGDSRSSSLPIRSLKVCVPPSSCMLSVVLDLLSAYKDFVVVVGVDVTHRNPKISLDLGFSNSDFDTVKLSSGLTDFVFERVFKISFCVSVFKIRCSL